MKTLYTFAINKVDEVEETIDSFNEKDEPVKIISKVKKEVPYEFALVKPSRRLIDAGELYYNITVSKGIQAGLFSQALLAKRYNNDGGYLSEAEKEDWKNKILERMEKEKNLQVLLVKMDKTEEEKKQYDKLIIEVTELDQSLRDYELRRQSLMDITAESRARTKTIVWWMLHLLHRKNEKGEFEPFFKGATDEELEDHQEQIEDDEGPDKQFNNDVVGRATQAAALWFYGQASKQEQFEEAFKPPVA